MKAKDVIRDALLVEINNVRSLIFMSTASNACLERVGRKNPLHTVERVGTKRLSA